ncbi:hypothetical protein H0H93_000353 [Arthromyces matolae]|nr:hypothetical protein H0H93_000353 [Arthromyces matolae]
MAFDQNVKSEGRESPSLGPTEEAHGSAKFFLPPPSSGSVNQVKGDETMQEPFSPLSRPKELDMIVKAEDELSPSQSPTLNDDSTPQKFKLSPSPTPPPSTTNGTASMSSTPPPFGVPPATSKKSAPVVQLIGDLPIAREEAIATFIEIDSNNYQYKSLGRSREALESMTCDCIFDPGGFQKREYANIDIVKTELKGFGLRAESFLLKDTFIYEYVGDVLSPASFKKRMREYAEEGIEHFYFMMLQKDEFIDATKSGGIGRFANHSCNPNCFVARWTIDQHVRMGIFAKRDIQKHEELTFNYNVDRYGHQAQTCYCGEPNCVGYIGGKTQTDAATMDDLVFDALGITDEAELMDVKGNKKKRGKKIDDPDFMASSYILTLIILRPAMKPIVEKDIPKVIQAIRQTQSRKVLSKLLTRIKLTEDQAALRQIMRLRGYSLMTNVLEDYKSDAELISLSLSCMSAWPLLNRNKVDDSRVIEHVRAIAESEDDRNSEIDDEVVEVKVVDADEWAFNQKHQNQGRELDLTRAKYRKPEQRERTLHSSYDFDRPRRSTAPDTAHQYVEKRNTEFSRDSIRAVIAAAAEAEAEAARTAAEAVVVAKAKAEAKAAARAAKVAKHEASKQESSQRKRQKVTKKPHTEEEKEAMKEKRLLKLVGAVVVKCMSKYSKVMDHDQFKKHAKELTQIIADKEKKSSSYKEGRLEKLSDEKVAKIKKFAKEYIAKILRKIGKSDKRPREMESSSAQLQSSPTLQDSFTRDEVVGEDVVMDDPEDLLEDMNIVSDSDAEEDADQDEESGETPNHPEEDVEEQSPAALRSVGETAAPESNEMDLDKGTVQAASIPLSSDPRRRPPEEELSTWEPPQGPNGM